MKFALKLTVSTIIGLSLIACTDEKHCLDNLTTKWVMTDHKVNRDKIIKEIKEGGAKEGIIATDAEIEAFLDKSIQGFIEANERIEFTPEGKFKLRDDEANFQLADDCKSVSIESTASTNQIITIHTLTSKKLVLEYADVRMDYKIESK